MSCQGTAPRLPTTRPVSDASLEKFGFIQPKMGTVFRIVVYAPDKATAEKAVGAAFARVDELNAILSDYDPKSELSRLSQQTNAGPMTRPARVSDDLWRMIDRGREAAALSDGAFDITIGPFTRLWRRSKEMKELPTPERIELTRKSVGFEHVKLDDREHTVQLVAPKMRLDVGGIAKGYTAEEAMKVLRRFGITRAVVGAAGDIAVGDPPPGKAYWRIGVQSLQRPDELAGSLLLHNCGISTSGDTYRVVEIDGKRYSHIVDPRTGLGLTGRIGVTAVAPDATTTDWLSTAVSVLGPEKGLALAEQIPGAAVRIVTLDDDSPGAPPVVRESKRFKAIGFEPAPTSRPDTRPSTFPTGDNGVE